MCTFNTLLTKIFAASEFLFIASYVIYSLGRLGLEPNLLSRVQIFNKFTCSIMELMRFDNAFIYTGGVQLIFHLKSNNYFFLI